MLKVDKKVFEKVIVRIVGFSDVRELMGEFSRDKVFFGSLLKDISNGKDSPNYHILKEIARDKKVSEQFIVDQARSVLSVLVPNEPKEDYYKILNVSHMASADEIRKSWLELVKTYHPDKVGDEGLDITKRLNEAYEVLGNPIKKGEYEAKCLPLVVVFSHSLRTGSKKLIYSVSLSIVMFAVIFYIAKSGLFFRSFDKKGEIAKEETRPPTPKALSGLDVKKGSLSKPQKENAAVALFSLPKETEKTLISKEMGKGIPKIKEKEKATKSEKKSESAVKKPPSTEIKKENKRVAISFPKEKQISGAQRESKEEEKKGVTPIRVLKENAKEEIERMIGEAAKKEEMIFKQGQAEQRAEVVEKESGKSVERLAKKETDGGQIRQDQNIGLRHLNLSPVVSKPPVAQSRSGQGAGGGRMVEKRRIGQTIKVAKETEEEPKGKAKREIVAAREGKGGVVASSVDKASLYSFVSEYTSAYKSRDMNLFMSLFESDARENGVEVSKAISSYRRNFSSLEIIEYNIQIKSVDFRDNRASVKGSFVLFFRNKSDQKIKGSNGIISWSLLWQDNRWKIKELNYAIKE